MSLSPQRSLLGRWLCAIALLIPSVVSADNFTVDGIHYVTTGNNTVAVTAGSTKYSGSVAIPSDVRANNQTYAVTSIGDQAFVNCGDLTSVTIPNSVTLIGTLAFSGCSDLTSVTIPNTVISFGEGVFVKCSGLTTVTLSSTLAAVPSRTFEGCSALTSVVIPGSAISIGDDAFFNCSALTSVTIPNSVTKIGANAFTACTGLTTLTIPKSVTSIDDYAFSGCSSLKELYCAAKMPPTCGFAVFEEVDTTTCVLLVPSESYDAYGKAAQWADFTNRVGYDFEGEEEPGTSGLESINSRILPTEIYDLQGRRVAQPRQGLYIVNGKTVKL